MCECYNTNFIFSGTAFEYKLQNEFSLAGLYMPGWRNGHQEQN